MLSFFGQICMDSLPDLLGFILLELFDCMFFFSGQICRIACLIQKDLFCCNYLIACFPFLDRFAWIVYLICSNLFLCVKYSENHKYMYISTIFILRINVMTVKYTLQICTFYFTSIMLDIE